MSSNIKVQVVEEVKASLMFSFLLNESVKVASCSLLMVHVFVRYMFEKICEKHLTGCIPLYNTRTAYDVKNKVSALF